VSLLIAITFVPGFMSLDSKGVFPTTSLFISTWASPLATLTSNADLFPIPVRFLINSPPKNTTKATPTIPKKYSRAVESGFSSLLIVDTAICT